LKNGEAGSLLSLGLPCFVSREFLLLLQLCTSVLYFPATSYLFTNVMHAYIYMFVCFYFVIVGKKLIEKKINKMTGPMAQ